MSRFRGFLRIWHADRVLSGTTCPFCQASFDLEEQDNRSVLVTCPKCGRRFRPS